MTYARNETEARLRSPGGWAQHGNAREQPRYVQLLPGRYRNRRRCRCGCDRKASHAGMCNGVTLRSGCEWSMIRWARDSPQPRHAT